MLEVTKMRQSTCVPCHRSWSGDGLSGAGSCYHPSMLEARGNCTMLSVEGVDVDEDEIIGPPDII